LLAREVTTKSHTGATHLPHLERVVFAIGVTCTDISFLCRGQLSKLTLSVCRGVAIMEVVIAQLDSEEVKVEDSDQSRQTMPWNEEVDKVEDSDEDSLE
jgi:hypothetical protein